MDDLEKFIFPIIKREIRPDPYAGERNVYKPGICMRQYCGESRWQHPEKGELVLCKHHAEEVFRGDAKAPPLRTGIDYQSGARKTFLVQDLAEIEKTIYQKTNKK